MVIKTSKAILIFIFAIVLLGNNTVFAQNSNQIKSMKWVKRTMETDIRNVIKPTVFKAFTKKELTIAKNIIVNVALDSRFSRVVAYRDEGKKKIDISTGFLSLMASLVDANIIASKFNKLSYLDDYRLLITNYINTYQDKVNKGNTPSWPVPFHKFVDISDHQYGKVLKSKEYDYSFSLNLRIITSYILAHEYAHHIFGHLTSKKPKDLSESRRNEDEADDFAIRVNWMLGNNPLLVSDYFVLFSLVENGLHDGTHAPSACRLEKFLDAGIKFTEAEAKNTGMPLNHEAKKHLNALKGAQKTLKKECSEGNSLTNTTIPGLWN